DELGDKVNNEERTKIESAISDLEAARTGGKVEDIKSKMDALYKAMEPISQKIYAEAQQQQQQAGGCGCGAEGAQDAGKQRSQESGKDKNDGDFVDADYKIVDDE
ncbi:MAG: molecular chaperone DnaK, partial [Candidatus Methanomethylophilaceae archaeon]